MASRFIDQLLSFKQKDSSLQDATRDAERDSESPAYHEFMLTRVRVTSLLFHAFMPVFMPLFVGSKVLIFFIAAHLFFAFLITTGGYVYKGGYSYLNTFLRLIH